VGTQLDAQLVAENPPQPSSYTAEVKMERKCFKKQQQQKSSTAGSRV